jgi:NAD(P)-dependent dehydrogenase (short-subunit alcohol dehydrogenase family)
MLLEGKNAIIYGAGGLGAGIAQTFAREGANVFLAGRRREPLEALAGEIGAEAAVLDALDEQAVDRHVAAVAEKAGRVDVSFNLISRGDVQGTPLLDMAVDDLVRPVVTGLTSTFITARAAARRMVEQGSGVILALDSGSAHGSPMMGGTGPADGATDTLIRNLATELGPQGVRALGLWAAGVPETLTVEKLSAVNPQITEEAVQGILQNLDQMRLLKRSPRLEEVANTAAFLASDRSALTGVWVNATGMFVS